MRVLKTLGFTALILLGIAGLVVDIGYGFFLAFDKTKTVDTFYANDQTPNNITELKDAGKLTDDQVTELEDRKLFEVNIYANSDETKKGVVLQELKMNYFTDQTLSTSSIISTGMQYVSDYNGRKGLYTTANSYDLEGMTVEEFVTAYLKGEVSLTDKLGKPLSQINELCQVIDFEDVASNSTNSAMADSYTSQDFNCYESVNFGVTWSAKGLQTELKRNKEFIIKLGSGESAEAYMIKLDGYEDTRWDRRPSPQWRWWPGNWYRNDDFGGRIAFYNWDNVFDDIMNAVLTNDMYTGTHYGVVNLSKYFTVTRHYNTVTKKWDVASDADQQIMYAVVKFNYHTEGAINNKQSLFGVIADDPRFTTDETEYDTDYAQSNIVYELTTASLTKRYSAAYDGYFLSLPIDMQRQLKAMPPYKINLTIDLTEKINGKQLVGFDVNAFDGFAMEKLTIKGDQTFYLLNNSLRNTNLATIDIADTVTIVNVDSGVNL